MSRKIILDIVQMVQESINGSIAEIRLVTDIDPEQINRIKTEKIALCIGILLISKYESVGLFEAGSNQFEQVVKQFLTRCPWNADLFDYLKNTSPQVREYLVGWYQKLGTEQEEINVGLIYEALLSFEWVHDSEGFRFIQDKSSRNRSGSYYTPQELADSSVRLLLDQIIEGQFNIKDFSQNSHKYQKNLIQISSFLSSLKVIDFSCGTGQFLKSVVRYYNCYLALENNHEIKEQMINQLISNIWGVDIDFIALCIAKNEIILETNFSGNMDALNKHFIHGNPLLPPVNSAITSDEKRTIAAKGYLYHPDLGLSWGEAEDETRNGFDLILGNPPWEKIRFEDKSFFRPWAGSIASTTKKDQRSEAIVNLKDSRPMLYGYYIKFTDSLNKSKALIQQRFHYSVSGELNTYSLFTELAVTNLSTKGRICYVVKSAIVVSPVNESIFKYLLKNKLMISCYDFINRKNIFAIDNRERFCVLILGLNSNDSFSYKSGLTIPEELFTTTDLRIRANDLELLNPLTGMLPSVTDRNELAFLLEMHSKHPVLSEVFPECKFGRIVHYTNHAEFIETEQSERNLPVYEGKLIELYDGRYSTYEGMQREEKYGSKASSKLMSEEMKEDPNCIPMSRYFIRKDKWNALTKNYQEQYSLMWRSLTSASNRRTCIATILPHMPASQSVQFLQLKNSNHLTLLLALFNSIVFDYMVRLKLNGIDLTQKILKQIAIPKLEDFSKNINFKGVEDTIYNHIAGRVAVLLGNDARLADFSRQIMPDNFSVNTVASNKRKTVIAELDILIAYTYGVSKEQWHAIVTSFPSYYNTEEIELFFDKLEDHSLL